jgi:hypothetical protein
MELIFEVREAEEGGYFARALGHSIFTQTESWDELRANVLEVTSLHFEEKVRWCQEKCVSLFRKVAFCCGRDKLLSAWAEDRAMRGRNPSAASGPRPGGGRRTVRSG